ncbi:hypothetical protein [uncultured Roseobacter sp.]|uniref:hypothetical protein n=1 Tax=uncultured Roseobacter sp. TaxID=114847 RepID=UPI00261AF434|nr:hypothetical protein [uncultured Roseobacter sp.]
MREGYKTFAMVWAEREITVSWQANWLNSGHCHIELRCDERLPVTQTGYRSHFVPQGSFADEAAVAAFVTKWLDEAADDKVWQAYLIDSRQLKLF